MSQVQIAAGSSPSKNLEQIVNDFLITFSTINGSGSATANNILLRSLFKIGIPVSGKNIFPSNIQGEPTWYTIRVNKDGFLARVEKDDIIVAMNPAITPASQVDLGARKPASIGGRSGTG